MADFDKLFATLKEQAEELIKLTVSAYANEARRDVQAFLDNSRDKLQQYTLLLTTGQISSEDFEWLVSGLKTQLKLQGLLQAGLTKIRLDQFTQALLSVVIDTVLRLVMPW